VWFFPNPIVLLGVIVFGMAFAVFDIREVVHQLDESRAGLVVIASALAVIHLGIASTSAL